MEDASKSVELKVLELDECAIQVLQQEQDHVMSVQASQSDVPRPENTQLHSNNENQANVHQSSVMEVEAGLESGGLRQRVGQEEAHSSQIKGGVVDGDLQIQSKKQSIDIPADLYECLKISSKIYLEAFFLESDVLLLSIFVPLAFKTLVMNFFSSSTIFVMTFPLWTLWITWVVWDDIYRGLFSRKRVRICLVVVACVFLLPIIYHYFVRLLADEFNYKAMEGFWWLLVAFFGLIMLSPDIMFRPAGFDESTDERFKNPVYKDLKLKAFKGLRRLLTMFNFFIHIEVTIVVLLYAYYFAADSYVVRLVIMPMFPIFFEVICIHFRNTRTYKEERRSYRLFSIFSTFSSVLQRVYMSQLGLNLKSIVMPVVLTSAMEIFLRVCHNFTVNIYYAITGLKSDTKGILNRRRNSSIVVRQETYNRIIQPLSSMKRLMVFGSAEDAYERAIWVWIYQQSEVRSLFAGPVVSFLYFWTLLGCGEDLETEFDPLVLLALQILVQVGSEIFCDIGCMALEMRYLKVPLNHPEVRPKNSPEAQGWMVFYGQVYGFLSLLLISSSASGSGCDLMNAGPNPFDDSKPTPTYPY